MRAATGPVGSLDLALDRLRSRHPCPDIHARLLKAPPYEALLTSGGDAELLVLGSRGVGGMSALLLGSTGAETATRADFPVTLVRPVPHSGDMPAGPVLLALDTERRPQDAVIGFAFEGAAMRKASLRALYVRDLVTRILAPGTPPERRVDAVMTGSPAAGEADAGVMTAYRIMRDRVVLRVPVVDAGRLVGVVTFDDLFWPAAQELNDLADVVGSARDLTQPL